MKGVGKLVGNFEWNPYRRPIWAWLQVFLTPKRDHVKTQNIYLFLYFFACNPKRRPSRLNMMAFGPEHPEWAQNPIFTPLSETTSIPTPVICGVPPPPRAWDTNANARKYTCELAQRKCKHKRKRRLKNGVGVVDVFRGVGCCDLEKAAFRLRLYDTE